MASQGSAQASQPELKGFTPRDLAQQILPDLNYKREFCTTTVALHKIYFTGKLSSWKGFTAEVTSFISQMEWKQSFLSYQSMHPEYPDINAIEHFRCGDESSVSGRFVGQVLHVVSAIAKESGFKSIFGDYGATANARGKNRCEQKACDYHSRAKGESVLQADKPTKGGDNESKREEGEDDNKKDSEKQKRYVPDYALLTEAECELQLVGEAKTPWKHDIKNWCRSFETEGAEEGEKHQDHSFRHALGQIAQYMQVFHLKYGFLTTYEQTIFLKQEETKNDTVLFYSPVIRYTQSQPSLRECILYMQNLVEQPKDFKQDATPWYFKNEVGNAASGIQWTVKQRTLEKSGAYKARRDKALGNDSDLQKEFEPTRFRLESQSTILVDLEKLTISSQDGGDGQKPAQTPECEICQPPRGNLTRRKLHGDSHAGAKDDLKRTIRSLGGTCPMRLHYHEVTDASPLTNLNISLEDVLQPHNINPRILEVVNLGDDSRDITDPIAVGIFEGSGVGPVHG